MNALQKLRQLHTDIAEAKDGFKVVDAWALAQRLIARMPVDQAEVKRVFAEQDAEGLDTLIRRLEDPDAFAPKQAPEATAQEMKDAMHAFRKRLKLARLNDESKLGGRHLSGGKKSDIDAIEPPRDYPKRVWDALVEAGRLRYTGQGFYADAEDGPR